MRWNDVGIECCAIALGRRIPVETAVADGRYAADTAEAHGYESISDAGAATTVDLAVDAMETTLKRADSDAENIDLLLYACCDEPPAGVPLPASAVQARCLPTPVSAMEVKQGCNSGVATLELAAAYLSSAREDATVAMVTTDRLRPGVERYTEDVGSVPGDGAAALLLTRGDAVATVLSIVVAGDGRLVPPKLEPAPPGADRKQVIAQRRRALLPLLRAMSRLQVDCVRRAVAEAGLTSTDIDRWVFANTGRFMVNRDTLAAMGADPDATTWDWGSTVGHMGASDQIGGLVHLLETGAVQPGGHVALCGSGVGASYGCAIVRVNTHPHWGSR